MSVFADSSALVKLYADEEGYEAVRAQPLLVVSAIARVEVPSALWRKQRLDELAVEDAELLSAAFKADYDGPRLAPIAIGARLLHRAAGLCATQSLRAYDAVQLASALAAHEADPDCREFVCFDAALREAAARSGFVLLPERVRAARPG